MNTRSPRAGDAVRTLLVALFVLLAIPVLLISLAFLGYRTTAAHAAEEAKLAEMAQRQAVQALERAQRDAKAKTDKASPRPVVIPGTDFKPVTETEYRRESVQTYQPVKDPVTGRITYKQTATERLVPVMRTRYLPAADPSITRLLAELQDLDETDEAYDRKMEELRTRLGLQFDSMHEAQANEIAKTEERLKSLKELHRKRGESKEKIVQRRMDELLGRDDALRWEIAPVPSADAPNYSTPIRPQALAPPANLGGDGLFVLPGELPEDAGDADITARDWPPLPPSPPSPPTPVLPRAWVPKPQDRTTNELNAPIQIEAEEIQIEAEETRRPTILEENEIDLVEETQDPGRSSPTIVRLFELARQLSSAEISAEIARDRIRQLQTLVENRALPTSEFKQESAKFARIQRELQLHEMEFEALDQALRRNQQAAATELNAADQELRRARQLYNSGRIDMDQVHEVELRRNQAVARAEEAKANFSYLKRIRDLLSDHQGEEINLETSEVSDESKESQESEVTGDSEEAQDRSDEDVEVDAINDPFGGGDEANEGDADPFGADRAVDDPFGSLNRSSLFRLAVAPLCNWPAS